MRPEQQETEIIPRTTDTSIIPGMHYPPPEPDVTWKDNPAYARANVRDFGHLGRSIQTLKFTAILLVNGILLACLFELIKLFFLKGFHGQG